MKISKFFETDYVNFSSYDNLRKISSVMDGQKNSSRKVLHTVLQKNIRDEIKLSQLGSKVAEFTEYLHGNLDGVIVNLAQDFLGTNNIHLMMPEGNFGTRFSPEASASRYIYTYGSQDLFKLFSKKDYPILKRQFFEGNEIEPMFFIPCLPMLLINGSEGMSSGFAQKILPRNPECMKKAIFQKLSGKKVEASQFVPFYKGFNGTIEQGDTPNQWIIRGTVKRISANKVEILEIPVGYDLKSYIDVLDDLEEKGTIQSYRDKSENDIFNFEVTVPIKILKEWDDDMLLGKLKLIKRVSENYTVMDETNKIKVFSSAEEILDHYISVKMDYLQIRKDNLIQEISDDIIFQKSKRIFIQNIVDGNLIINNRSKSSVETDLEVIDGIIKRDDSFDYLLNMNIMSLTKDRIEILNRDISSKEEELSKVQNQTLKEMWEEDLK